MNMERALQKQSINMTARQRQNPNTDRALKQASNQ